MLFKPVVGIRLVVEGCYLLVSSVSVQFDSFSEVVVRFQVKDRDSRFPCIALQFLKQTPSQPKTTRSWGDPHALEFRRRVLVKLYSTTAHRLLSQTGNEQQARRGREFVRMRRNTERWIETSLEALVEFGEVLLDAPSGILAGWIGDSDLDH